MPGWTNGRQAAGGYLNPHQAARILRRDGRICHVCKHGDAEQVDHIVPWAEGGTHGDANLAPIHGAACPECGAECHKGKTQAEAARGRQRRAARGRRPPEPHPGALAARPTRRTG